MLDYNTADGLKELYFKTNYYINFNPEAKNINSLYNLKNDIETILIKNGDLVDTS